MELLEFNWPLLLPKLGRMQPATTACAMLSCVALAASFCAFPGQMSFRRPTEQEAFAKALEGIAGGQLSALPVKQPAPRTTGGRNWCWRWHRRAALAGALGASSAELSRILDFCHLVSSRCLPRLFLQDCAWHRYSSVSDSAVLPLSRKACQEVTVLSALAPIAVSNVAVQ